jgi:hypothetical protein
MKTKMITVLTLLVMSLFIACSVNNKTDKEEKKVVDKTCNASKCKKEKVEPHRYGGWYCPDNLKGFPAVDIADWKNVPVVNGRMATKEESQNGTSLIFVDMELYPNAKHLDIKMPRLASFFNQSANREDLVIVIQAINVDNDSVVGFRYLNGGNGSANLSEVKLLSKNEIEALTPSKFVTQTVHITAMQDKVWDVLTNSDYKSELDQTFNSKNNLSHDWRKTTNVNFHYANAGNITAPYADKLYGNFYIQNDYDNLQYTEKFFVFYNQETMQTELKLVCGPFRDDFDVQNKALSNWAKQVKILSEKE